MRSRLRQEVARDVDAEIAYHLDRTVADLESAGLEPDRARATARRRFGRVSRYRRELIRLSNITRHRRQRRSHMVAIVEMLRSVRRRLFRSPGYAAAVVAILALGIGMNGVTFRLADRILLRPPAHIVDADTVKRIWVHREVHGTRYDMRAHAYADLEDLFSADSLDQVVASARRSAVLGRGASAERVITVAAAGGYFPMLGTRPYRGRFFGPDDDRPDREIVAVVSHAFWKGRLGGEADAIGRRLELDGRAVTVVGVAPAGFTGAELQRVDVWLPLEPWSAVSEAPWRTHRGYYWLQGLARLAPGVDAESAGVEATVLHRRARGGQADSRYDPEAEISFAPLLAAHGPNRPPEARIALLLVGVAAIVLLIACFNVAHLVLARMTWRRHEYSLRLALGISRGRLAGEILLESLVLAFLGATVSLILVAWGSELMRALLLPRLAWSASSLDPAGIAFVVSAAAFAGLAAAVLPMARVLRLDPRIGSRVDRAAGSRAKRVLVAAQAAFSTVLLIGAGLFVRSLDRVTDLDLGFDPERLVVVAMDLENGVSTDEGIAVADRVLDALRSRPEVTRAAAVQHDPFRDSASVSVRLASGEAPRADSRGPYFEPVGAEYFETMGLEVLRGRGLESRDDRVGVEPVVVVNQAMAAFFWPTGDAIGECLFIGDDDAPCSRVIGVVENAHRQQVIEERQLLYYVPLVHAAFGREVPKIVARVDGDPEALAASLRAEVLEVAGARIRFAAVDPMADRVAPQLRSWRLGATLFGTMGILALVVAALGLYTALAFDVATRWHEIGVRSALGATARQLVALVLRRGAGLALVGVACGLVIAFVTGVWIDDLLYDMTSRDPVTFLGVSTLLVVTGLFACWLPARRASAADPATVLRSD